MSLLQSKGGNLWGWLRYGALVFHPTLSQGGGAFDTASICMFALLTRSRLTFLFFFLLLSRVEWTGVSGLLAELPTALVPGLFDGSSSCQRSPKSSLCPWQPGSFAGSSHCGESHCRATEVTRLRRRLRDGCQGDHGPTT